MKITEVIKKDGSKVYRANIYLGVDQVTGKKVKTKVTGRTQKEVKQKATQEKNCFSKSRIHQTKGQHHKKLSRISQSLVESYKNTVKPNTQGNVRKLIDNHILPIFGAYKLDKLTTPLIQSIINKLADKSQHLDRIAVVGGGYIGVELAEAFERLGKEVSTC